MLVLVIRTKTKTDMEYVKQP